MDKTPSGALSIGAILYFNGWISSNRHWTELLFQPQRFARVNNDELYTGSVIMVPSRGDKCWQLLFDNRMGRRRTTAISTATRP